MSRLVGVNRSIRQNLDSRFTKNNSMAAFLARIPITFTEKQLVLPVDPVSPPAPVYQTFHLNDQGKAISKNASTSIFFTRTLILHAVREVTKPKCHDLAELFTGATVPYGYLTSSNNSSRFYLDFEKEFEHLHICETAPDIRYAGSADMAIIVHQEKMEPGIHVCVMAKAPGVFHIAFDEMIRSLAVIQAGRHRLENGGTYPVVWGVLSLGMRYRFIHLGENRECYWSG
ncbi:hypothetical protein BO70DRAFT_393118 [Aspergillus heteromorphus CBS 117.55]|uniref:Uncharacterized protein n=1 Tax=Aspergillus heteromorphus CBS 117.55 TaxID=1448321 RepID=A0A317WV11_9EURO|nr:uncharacterized protein BO70DRAFT_393118 [Aspergillus heteromorphus CBS 117.55]PWY89925.1 hypothetical protein BO70DRAFT_393118 [Aspergillus heteromorphus CBS 117.55]